jgi:glycosyltransferase involved in cell wall biosynthesis
MTSLCGKHILIVSVHYWPEETGIGPYSTGMAEHFASEGAKVTVLTAMPFYPQWRVRNGYRQAVVKTERHHGVEIRRVRHYVPKRQSAIRRALYEVSFLSCLLRTPWRTRPDAIIGVIPSLSGGIAARVISTVAKVPYGIIVQDLSGQAAKQSGISGGSAIARVTAVLEGIINRRAANIAIVSPAFRTPLEILGVRPDAIAEVRNWSHISSPSADRNRTRQELGWGPDEFIVLHAGNMGLKQGLEHLLEAARLAEVGLPSVRFVLMGDGNQRQSLVQLAHGLGNVMFLDPVDAAAFPDVLAAADVLLVHERATVMDMSLPSKLTSYFMAGQPVLAVVNPDGATATEIERSSAGMVVASENSGELMAALSKLREDSALRECFADHGRAYVKRQLSFEASTTALSRFMQGVIHEKSG